MITKQELCDAALTKIGMGRGETLTGYSGKTLQDALRELEAMMAQWMAAGWDVFYQFSVPDESRGDVTPRPGEDSMIELSWKSAVVSNLACRLCPLFELPVPVNVGNEAQVGELQLVTHFTSVPNRSDSSSTWYISGSGNRARKW